MHVEHKRGAGHDACTADKENGACVCVKECETDGRQKCVCVCVYTTTYDRSNLTRII